MSLNLYICHLWQPYLSVAHISDPAIPPKHVLLKLLMLGTGINYFFHERDFEEFLIRLHLSYRHFNVLESLLLHNHIFEAKYGDELLRLTTEDLQSVQGLVNAPNSQRVSRESWLHNAPNGWQNVTFSGIFCGFHLHTIEQKSERLHEINASKFNFEVTQQILTEAELFAREVLKEMDLHQLRKWHTDNKSLILEVRNKTVKPFNYHPQAIPADVKQGILDNFLKYGWGVDEPFSSEWRDEDELSDEVIKLAWLHANDLLMKDVEGYWVADGNFGLDIPLLEEMDCHFYDLISVLKLDDFKEKLKAPVGTSPHHEEVKEEYEFLEL